MNSFSSLKPYRLWEDVLLDIKDDLDFEEVEVEENLSLNINVSQKQNGIYSSDIESIIKTLTNDEEQLTQQPQSQPSVPSKFFNLYSFARSDEQTLLKDVINTMSSCSPTNRNSKFYNPKKPLLTSLYESLDKCLTLLRSLTPHSVPFLHRVSRKDVPDYYVIVKNPIDLGSIGRKLKEFLYSSKEEFVEDLELMRDNCYLFNEDPSSPFRRSADILRDRWISILSLLPEDIGRRDFNDDHNDDHNDDNHNIRPLKNGGVFRNLQHVNDETDVPIEDQMILKLSPWPKRGVFTNFSSKYPIEIMEFHQGIPAVIKETHKQTNNLGIRKIISTIMRDSGFTTIHSDCMYIICEALEENILKNINLIREPSLLLERKNDKIVVDLIEFLGKNK